MDITQAELVGTFCFLSFTFIIPFFQPQNPVFSNCGSLQVWDLLHSLQLQVWALKQSTPSSYEPMHGL